MWWYLEVGPLESNYIIRVEPSWMILVSLLQRPWRAPFPLHHEDMARRWPSMNQEVGVCQVPHQDSTLILDSAASITVRHKFSLFIKHQSMIFCHSRPDRLRQGLRLINLKKKKKKRNYLSFKAKTRVPGKVRTCPLWNVCISCGL